MIRRQILAAGAFGVLTALTAIPVLAQERQTSEPATGPRLLVRETNFNFGFTPQNVKISHEYWLISGGMDTLRLTDIKAP